MGNINNIQITFSVVTCIVILLSILVNKFEKVAPSFVQRLVRYGKFAYSGHSSSVQKIELPKSYSKHIYVYSVVVSSLVLILLNAIYIFHLPVPQTVIYILNLTGGDDREAHVNSASVILATTLMTLQCYRRFYDTHYISVFAKSSQINIIHYGSSYVYYTGVFLAILVEAPNISSESSSESTLNWFDLSYIQLSAAVVFIWSWKHQQKVTIILGNLRKNNKGGPVVNNYSVSGNFVE